MLYRLYESSNRSFYKLTPQTNTDIYTHLNEMVDNIWFTMFFHLYMFTVLVRDDYEANRVLSQMKSISLNKRCEKSGPW